MKFLSIILSALFVSSALSVESLAGAPADGQYTVSVTLSGGSGRAGVESPAVITLDAGVATAVIVWSSPYYEYMQIDGVLYYPINTEGNTAFEIPVEFDDDIFLTARTVAMSQPHDIDYVLRLDSATLTPVGGAGKAAIIPPAAVVLVALAATGILWRKRYTRER